MNSFKGFSAQATQFFTDIIFNNDKGWFEANKHIFQAEVQRPAQLFVTAVGERLRDFLPHIRYDTSLNGGGSIMRLYRDTRFSPDKTPYKTNLGIMWWEGTGKKMEHPGYYFHLDAQEVWLASGFYQFSAEMLAKYRTAVADEEHGPALAAIVADLQAAGYTVGGHHYKRVPRGYAADHPRAALLCHNGLYATTPFIPSEIVHTAALVEHCASHARTLAPLHQWLVATQTRGE